MTIEWSDTLCNRKLVNHAAAEKACAALGDGWRLPTIEELFLLFDRSRKQTRTVNSDTMMDWYWSDTPYKQILGTVWVVDFFDGRTDRIVRSAHSAHVRAVRDVQGISINVT